MLAENMEEFKLDLARRLEEHKSDLTTRLEAHKSDLQSQVETHKAKLAFENAKAIDAAKFEFEQQLIERRGEIDLAREGYKISAESEKQRAERLRAQAQRWALPIQGAIEDLRHRIADILTNEGHLMLDENAPRVTGWSADYSYYMSSTVYFFSQYFCWTRLMQQQLGHDLFDSTGDMRLFLDYVNSIGDTIGRFPFHPEGDPDGTVDAQVFRLQQRAAGELLLNRQASGEQIMTFREFADKWHAKDDPSFAQHVRPLVHFLDKLAKNQDLRWNRLSNLHQELEKFSELCATLLQSPPAHDA